MGYKLTIKALVISVIALIITCVGALVVYATESGGTTQTLQVVLNDLEQQEADKVVTLPDKAVIKNVSVNTGEVTYEKSGNSVTLHLKNGEGTTTTETYWNEKKESKCKELCIPTYYHCSGSKPYSEYPETRSYSEDGFNGELKRSGWYRCCGSEPHTWGVSYSGHIYKGGYDTREVTKYSYTVNIDYIVDTIPPQLDVSYNNSPTNGNVTFSVNANDSVSGIKEITLPNGSIVSESTTYEVSTNGDYTFTATDNMGNVATKTVTVSCIDKTAPSLDINYDNSLTKDNIILSVSSTDTESGIKEITLPNGSVITEPTTTYEVSTNGDYTFTATDSMGNNTTKTVTVSCIDKTKPNIEVNYDNSLTKDNIILSVSSTDTESGIKEITLPNGSVITEPTTTYEITENGDYSFTTTDNAGNVATKTITISCIDNTPPTLEINYNNNPTNKNIIISVSATDTESGIKEIALPDGSIVSELPAEYEVTENGDYTFTATDNAGNVTIKSITVSNIDITPPQLEITFDNNPTNENIILSVSATDTESGIKEIALPDGSIVSELPTEYEVTENGDYTFTATDNAGNVTTKTVTISNIDKDLPIISSHKIDYKENKIYVTIESDEENLTYLISESEDIKDLEFQSENVFELSCEGTYYAFVKDTVGNISLPYEIIVSSPKLPQISVDIENGELQGGTSVTITVTSQDTELKSYKYIVTSSADYPLLDDTWITPETTDPQTVTINTEGEQYIHVFANDVFGNITTKTFGSYIITPKPVVTEPTQTDTSPQTVVTESNEEKTIETEEVITTEPIETQEIPIETELPQTKIITPEIAPPEVIFPTVTENIEEEKQPKEIPVLVIGNEDKNFILYEEDIEGVETIQVLDDTGNEIAEFEPENIEKIKVNPPKKDGYDFVGYEKTHIETYLVLTPIYKASPGYDGMEIFEISPSPMPESVVNISNLDNQSTLLRGLVYTIAILAIIVLILSIIALAYKISNLRADRNSR